MNGKPTRQQRLERVAARMADRLDRIEARLNREPDYPIARWHQACRAYERVAQELLELEQHGVSFTPAARIEARTVQARRAGTRL